MRSTIELLRPRLAIYPLRRFLMPGAVSRGYDRVIGQLLRYMSWIEKNLAEQRKVRGVIVAAQITDDLKLAASRIPDVRLVEYEISFSIKPVSRD